MGKLFNSILNNRLLEWAEDNSKINDSQFGFPKNRRTTDGLFVVYTISLLAIKRKKPKFVAFIDLVKAFDSVYHGSPLVKAFSNGYKHKNVKNYPTHV